MRPAASGSDASIPAKHRPGEALHSSFLWRPSARPASYSHGKFDFPASVACPGKSGHARRRVSEPPPFPTTNRLRVHRHTGAIRRLVQRRAGRNPLELWEGLTQVSGPTQSGVQSGLAIDQQENRQHLQQFYEFSPSDKEIVHKLAVRLATTPWPIEISGLVEKPIRIDATELVARFPLEERVYRFRCVEAWAMIVPWTGFPFAKLIEKAKPKSECRFIRFRRSIVPSKLRACDCESYPWPYFEGLTLAEAMIELAILVTGIYGNQLPNQHGAPLRLACRGSTATRAPRRLLRSSSPPPNRGRSGTRWRERVPL